MHLLAVSVYILLSDKGKAASSYCTSIPSLLFAKASFHMAQFRSVWLLCYSMCVSGTQRPLGGSQGLAGPQAGGLAGAHPSMEVAEVVAGSQHDQRLSYHAWIWLGRSRN